MPYFFIGDLLIVEMSYFRYIYYIFPLKHSFFSSTQTKKTNRLEPSTSGFHNLSSKLLTMLFFKLKRSALVLQMTRTNFPI